MKCRYKIEQIAPPHTARMVFRLVESATGDDWELQVEFHTREGSCDPKN